MFMLFDAAAHVIIKIKSQHAEHYVLSNLTIYNYI